MEETLGRSELVWKLVNLVTEADDKELSVLVEKLLGKKMSVVEGGMGDYYILKDS